MTHHLFKKIIAIKQALNGRFYERETEIEGMLVALFSRQHMLMIGPAGTAKSALASEFANIVEGASYFQWMLTKFSTPEEIFGPLSLRDLERGEYKRLTVGKMPEAELVFIDEIFKANSAILNSLLTLINERLFYNSGLPTVVPLQSLLAASNDYPEEGEGLEALFDRFLLRYEVGFIAEAHNFMAMMQADEQNEPLPSITGQELAELQKMTAQINIPNEVFEILSKIRLALQDEGIYPSDRRFKKSLSILQAKAFINERREVRMSDLSILKHVLWETIDQKEVVSALIENYSYKDVRETLATLQNEANDIFYTLQYDRSSEIGMEAAQKMQSIAAQLNELKKHDDNRTPEIDRVLDRVTSMQHEMLDRIMDPWYFDVNQGNKAPTSMFFKM